MSEITEILEEIENERGKQSDSIMRLHPHGIKLLERIQSLLQSHAVVGEATARHLGVMAVVNRSHCIAECIKYGVTPENAEKTADEGVVGNTVVVIQSELSRLTLIGEGK